MEVLSRIIKENYAEPAIRKTEKAAFELGDLKIMSAGLVVSLVHVYLFCSGNEFACITAWLSM